MAAKYVLSPKPGGKCDVLFAQMFPREELVQRYAEMVRCGWPEDEAWSEIQSVNSTMRPCNQNPEGYAPATCREFIVTYAEPGDVIVERGRVFIVQKKVSE